ncbi:MAG: hotdog domain-containing protein [Planctomycetota bacterium]|nr:hotdog domain-containing protein [Planctomycetota bacterium]
MKLGDVIEWSRRFTMEDARNFTSISKDEGQHHLTPDDQGRIIIQGLLTATLPTRVGGALDFLARNMSFDFLKPVYVDDTVTCTVTIVELRESRHGTRMKADISCKNQAGVDVLAGSTSGVILKPLEDVLASPVPKLSSF